MAFMAYTLDLAASLIDYFPLTALRPVPIPEKDIADNIAIYDSDSERSFVTVSDSLHSWHSSDFSDFSECCHLQDQHVRHEGKLGYISPLESSLKDRTDNPPPHTIKPAKPKQGYYKDINSWIGYPLPYPQEDMESPPDPNDPDDNNNMDDLNLREMQEAAEALDPDLRFARGHHPSVHKFLRLPEDGEPDDFDWDDATAMSQAIRIRWPSLRMHPRYMMLLRGAIVGSRKNIRFECLFNFLKRGASEIFLFHKAWLYYKAELHEPIVIDVEGMTK